MVYIRYYYMINLTVLIDVLLFMMKKKWTSDETSCLYGLLIR
jgi:hypothetical protein